MDRSVKSGLKLKPCVVVLFALLFGSRFVYADITGPEVVSVGDEVVYENTYVPEFPVLSLVWEVEGGTILSYDSQHAEVLWEISGNRKVSLSIQEDDGTQTIVTDYYSVTVHWFSFSDGGYEEGHELVQAFDNDTNTYYQMLSGQDMNINIDLKKTVKACKLSINASEPFIAVKTDNVIYDYTMGNENMLYIVNPSGYSSIQIESSSMNPDVDYNVYEIELEEIEINRVKFRYEYDAAGNMNYRHLVLGAAPSYKKQNNVTYDKAVVEQIGASDNEEKLVETEVGDKSIKIYPNPTKGLLKIDVTNYNDGDITEVIVYTLSGEVLFRGDGQVNEIDLSAEPAGMYILSLNINGKYQNWNIIKE